MAELERFSSAIAILIGFAGLGMVLHSGLASIAAAIDGHATQPLAASGSAPRPTSGALDAPSRSATPASAPADSALLQRDRALRIEALSLSAIAPQRPAYAAACFRAKEMPLPFWVGVALTFDAQGHETSRQLTGEPGTEPPFVECLRRVKQPPLTIEAQGQVTQVTVRITVP